MVVLTDIISMASAVKFFLISSHELRKIYILTLNSFVNLHINFQ